MFWRGCKGNVLSINANIIIVFLGYSCQKTISMNNTFRECRSKVNNTGLLSDIGTLTATTLSILGLSRWNKNWNVRNSHSYVATAFGFTLQLWKFSDFCSRHTVGVAGDDIMFHILVAISWSLEQAVELSVVWDATCGVHMTSLWCTYGYSRPAYASACILFHRFHTLRCCSSGNAHSGPLYTLWIFRHEFQSQTDTRMKS